jgi:EAL domain-containing protein (putative c-di-GMP-specific phosphodiesterase class I)
MIVEVLVMPMISTTEGVETLQQMDTAQSMGCSEMLGYLFSHSQFAKEIGRFFSSAVATALDAA